LLCLILTALPVHGEEIVREFTFESSALHLSHMIGEVTVRQGATDAFRVQVTVRGGDAAPGLIEFITDDDDGKGLVIGFPIDDHTRYVYPELGRGSKTTITFQGQESHEGSWLKRVFAGMSGKKITVTGDGRGLELWADVVVEVPRGGDLEVKLGVGEITAADLAADLNLDTNSGAIYVERLTGDLLADTGSGRVAVAGIDGEVNIDTGSGSVSVSDCRGDEIKVDTGSGGVDAAKISCENFDVDTGSGSVEAIGIATDKARIDTGSGSVTLQLDRMGTGRFVIDTGSGSIDLMLPANASARIEADTGSGSVKSRIDGAEIHRKSRDELEMTVGGGEARVTLDAGSGSITIGME